METDNGLNPDVIHTATNQGVPVKRWGISGSVLKLIALVSMLIDHIGAGILEFLIEPSVQINEAGEYWYFRTEEQIFLLNLNEVFRGIGRIAFPIYCFLLVEGFMHTRNVWKYLLRLTVFAVISEIPFDLCAFHSIWYTGHQNVFFTLALGLCLMIILKKISLLPLTKTDERKSFISPELFRSALSIAAVCLICLAAYALDSDYGMRGILMICIIYCLRDNRLAQAVATGVSGCLFFAELPALASIIPIALYNGKRGSKLKYLFYAFYPVHLFIIWAVGKWILGI